jgi:hypothetical protein
VRVRILASRAIEGVLAVVVDLGSVAYLITETGAVVRAELDGSGRVVRAQEAEWRDCGRCAASEIETLLPREGVPDAAKAARGGRLYYGRLNLGRLVEIEDGEL